MAGRRKKTGDRRIDAAIDHFVRLGFKKVDIRNIVNSLLRNVYGNDGWPFLEENCYHVVLEALLEKQEQEEKLQMEILRRKQQEEEEEEEEEEQQQQQQQQQDDDEEEVQHVQEEQQEEEWEWEDDDEDQQQEATMMGEPPENDMPIVEVHNEVPSETVIKVEQTEEVVRVPMIIDPPALKAARTGRTSRRPCHGWISESESDSDDEELPASRQQQVPVLSPGEDLPKRKRRSRWDV